MYTEIPRHKSLTLYDPDPDWTTEEILEYQRVTDDEFEFFLELERQENARRVFLNSLKRRHRRRQKLEHPKARHHRLYVLLDRISPGWDDNWVEPGYEDYVL